MKKAIAAVLFCLSCAFASAAASRGDSLLNVLHGLPDDSSKVLTLNELFKNYLYSDPKRAHGYALRAYKLSQKIGWLQGTAKMANNLGVYHSKQGQFDKALAYYDQVMTIRIRQGNSVEMAHVHMNVGGVLYKKSAFEESLTRFNEALRLYFASKDTSGMLGALGNIATVRKEKGELPEAQEAYLNVLRMQEVMGNQREVARTALNIGAILHQQGYMDAAWTWYDRSQAIADSLDDNFLRASAMNSRAELYIDQDSFQSARMLLDSSILIAIRTGDSYSEAFGYMLLSDLQIQDGDRLAAQEGLEKALAICREIGRKQGEASVLYRLGNLYLNQKKYAEAVPYFRDAAAISREILSRSLTLDILKALSAAYAGTGDFELAYQTHADFFMLYESIYSAEKSGQITEMHERYESEEKQEKIDALSLEHTQDLLRIYRSRQGNYLLWAVLFVILFVLFFFLYRYRQKQRLSRQIAVKNKEIAAQRDYAELQNLRILLINSNLEALVEARTSAVVAAKHELDTFLYESAHALRRPITRIDGLLNLILEEQNADTAQDLRSRLDLTLHNMDALLHKLIMVNEISRREPQLEQIALAKLVQELREEAIPDQVHLHDELPAAQAILSDAYVLRAILLALLENAAAYHPKTETHQAHVWVRWQAEPKHDLLRVEDNGSGIPENMRDKIFAMFVRGTVQGSGNGLGLYVARAAAERLGYSLSFSPRAEGGSRFELRIPRG